MTAIDPRTPIFQFLAPHLKNGWNDPGLIAAMHGHLDALHADAEPISAIAPPPSSGRKTGLAGRKFMQSFEHCILNAYKDPGSVNGLPITIGWGTTTDEDGGPIKLGNLWTQEKADRLYARDLDRFERRLNALLGAAPATQNQFDALMSLGYNIGMGDGGLKTSTVLRRHLAKDYAGAANAFLMWDKNDGKVMPGLVRRRRAERLLYLDTSA